MGSPPDFKEKYEWLEKVKAAYTSAAFRH